MKSPAVVSLGWLGVILCCWPWQTGSGDSGPRTAVGAESSAQSSLGRRLLGPVAGIAASVEWVRFDWYVREGRFERAYAAAERALALDPRATQGWTHFASHLVFSRASLESEPDPAARRRWIQAGLDLLGRGEGRASVPADLAFMRGLVLSWVTDLEGLGPPAALGWPGGKDAARLASADAFHAAGVAGNLEGYLMEGILRTGKRPPAPDPEGGGRSGH